MHLSFRPDVYAADLVDVGRETICMTWIIGVLDSRGDTKWLPERRTDFDQTYIGGLIQLGEAPTSGVRELEKSQTFKRRALPERILIVDRVPARESVDIRPTRESDRVLLRELVRICNVPPLQYRRSGSASPRTLCCRQGTTSSRRVPPSGNLSNATLSTCRKNTYSTTNRASRR